jgi:hypothetical protein
MARVRNHAWIATRSSPSQCNVRCSGAVAPFTGNPWNHLAWDKAFAVHHRGRVTAETLGGLLFIDLPAQRSVERTGNFLGMIGCYVETDAPKKADPRLIKIVFALVEKALPMRAAAECPDMRCLERLASICDRVCRSSLFGRHRIVERPNFEADGLL